jgi:hypothetical protein
MGLQYMIETETFGGGVDNTGVDSVTLDYVPEKIEDDVSRAQYVTSLISNPHEENEVSVEFNAHTPGKLILEATSRGRGGGAHMVYLDEDCIGGSNTGNYSGVGPAYKTVPVMEAGNYVLTVRHEDTYFPDNQGTRGINVYYLPFE